MASAPPPDPLAGAPSVGSSSSGNFGAGANGAMAVNPQLLGTLANDLPGLPPNPTVDEVVQAFEKAPEQTRAQIQGLLYSGGFYPSTYTPLIGGVIRTQDRDAFASAVVISVQSGEAVPDYLTSAVQAAQSVGSTSSSTKRVQPPAVIEPGIVAPGVQSSGGHYTIRLSNPTDLAFITDQVASKLLGRDATGAEKQAVINSYQQFQTDQQNTEITGQEGSRRATFDAQAGARNDQFNANVAERNAQFGANVENRNSQYGRPAGSGDMSVPQAIMAATDDPRVRLAMMMGSHMEGGWGPNYGTGDGGGSTGPFQINHNDGMHSDISVADTKDPAKATQYMLGEYQAAVAKVPDSLWQSDPKAAAEQAAVLAERPAVPYHESQGQGAVDDAFSAATGVLNAVAPDTSGDTGPGSAAGDKIRSGYSETGVAPKPGQQIGSLTAPAVPDRALPDVKLPDNFVPGTTTTVTTPGSPDAYATEAYKFADPNEYNAHQSAAVYGMMLKAVQGGAGV